MMKIVVFGGYLKLIQ